MASNKVHINKMADEIMKGLNEYADLASSDLKKAVTKSGRTVKKEIQKNAPKKTGGYAKSWSVKKKYETANAIGIIVCSKKKYQMAHLLEFGHAKRNGGRTNAQAHIKPAQKKGEKELEEEIKRLLGG